MIAPLKKRKPCGAAYTRPGLIEAKLAELASLSRTDLIARCKIQREDDPGYVPSECVLHFLRGYKLPTDTADFERLYRLLFARLLLRLPPADNPGAETASLSKTKIRETTCDMFVDMILADASGYSSRLDFYEIRFNKAVVCLLRDARRKIWRQERGMTELEADDESGAPSAEVEEAAGSYNPFDPGEFDPSEYAPRLDKAIDALPDHLQTIVQMLRKGIPIESKDPQTVTIAGTLKKSEKTIRTHRDKAFKKLKATLTAGE